MADPTIRAFLDAVETREILPIVPPVPGQDLMEYKRLIIERFSNPDVADTVRRLCLDGSNRQPKFIIPSIRDVLDSGGDAAGLILLSAMWCRYCAGTDEAGRVIEPNDPNWDTLKSHALAARSNPSEWIGMSAIYGDLARNAGFAARFAEALNFVWANGAEAAMRRYIG
jgi:mannitol 2-dehydrogenase